MKTVLLTNAQQRKTLAVARSLGSRGVRVIAAEETRFNPTTFSKYCKKTLVYPNPRENESEFYKWLIDTIVKYKCEVLFPMDDDTMDVVMKYYDEVSRFCIIPVPKKESYEKASDKGESVKLANAARVNCPDTLFLDNLDKLEDISVNLKFPVVIKPKKSSGSRGIRIVHDRESFISEYLAIHKMYPYPMIQEYVNTGDRFDVCMLFNKNSLPKAYFVQKELRHFPVEIGPSTVQEGIVFPELVDMCLRIMKNLEWYGVVELEFMRDSKDGEVKFMEINPRFWGSLQMSILSGIDFPWLLYKLALNEEIGENFNYKCGIRCQWLLPGDILHYVFNKKRRQMDPPFLGGKKHLLYDDIISKDDPFPILGFILACMKYLFNLKMWKLMFKR